MNALRKPHVLALAAAALFAAPAVLASGDYGEPRDELVSRGGPDVDRDPLLHGQVGIVLPTWDTMSQYLAWRAIVTAGKPAFHATTPARVASDVPAGWTDAAAPEHADAGDAPHFSSRDDRPNCSPDAQSFAGTTLAAIKARADKTPARIDAWIAAQQQVFALCERDPLEVLASPDPLVAPLPAAEPLYWRQLREYQMAAAAFYAAHYGQSRAAFERIGHTAGHPMQTWGAYLALRSHLRQVQLPTGPAPKPDAKGRMPTPPEQVADLEALRKEGALILHDAALASVHEATAATLRRAAFLLAPTHRFAELTAMLDDLRADPDRDDALDDWPFMGYGTGDDAADARTLVTLRAAHPWFDWVNTITRDNSDDARRLSSASRAPAAASGACAGECAHATQAWSHSPAVSQGPEDAAAGQHRAWLLATLMTQAPLTPAVEREALAVLTRAPEYASVRYYLADRLAASGQAEGARTMSEGLLARLRAQKPASTSAINLVTQQRFGLATSVADATTYLLMSPEAATNPDTGERAAPADIVLMPSDGGAHWLDRSLSVADLLVVARALPTPSGWRTRIAVAAWMRADLLGDAPAAEDASKLVEAWVPSLKPVTSRYRALPAGAERQHWLIVNALKRGLSPDPFAGYRDGDGQYPVQKPDEVVADLWCRIGAADSPDDAKGPLPLPDVSGDRARRDADRARLLKLHSATGFVGLHAIDWAETHPTDKDAAWLLYVAIQSSKRGCIDPDHTAISKKAWQVLHKRFPRSTWTEQSPYFY